MLQSDEEIYLTVIASTFLITLLAVMVVLAMVRYQRNMQKYLKEINDMKLVYQQELMKAKLEIQEQTFLTISQEIHDNIGQILSLIRLNISRIKPDDYDFSKQKIDMSKDLLDKAITDLRDLSKRLNTDYVNRQDLSESLKFQLELLQKTGLFETEFQIHGEEKLLEPEKKLIIFRIVQELLNNILKHADSTHISVILMYVDNELILSVKDDGKGFIVPVNIDEENKMNGIGLYNLFYRAKLIGAHFSLKSEPGGGTLAQLILPLNLN